MTQVVTTCWVMRNFPVPYLLTRMAFSLTIKAGDLVHATPCPIIIKAVPPHMKLDIILASYTSGVMMVVALVMISGILTHRRLDLLLFYLPVFLTQPEKETPPRTSATHLTRQAKQIVAQAEW